MTTCQVEGDGFKPAPDPAANLDQLQPQSAELQVDHMQPVGGGMRQEAKLIRPETMAAQTISEAAILETLNTEFGTITALRVPGIEIIWRIHASGDHQADVEPLLLFSGQPTGKERADLAEGRPLSDP